MPQLQIVDTGPERGPDPLGGILGEFANRREKRLTEEKDRSEIDKIYNQYLQDGRDIERAYFETQKSGLSPTAKVNATKDLLDLHKTNMAYQQKALSQKEREEKEKLRLEEIDRKAKEKVDQQRQKDVKIAAEKRAPFESGLETVKQMKEIRKRGNLGIASPLTGIIYPDVRRDRAEYERLGKSLISLSSNIPIRNRQEFEVLANDLFDPNMTDAAAEGILSAMENILQRNIKQYSTPENQSESPKQDQPMGKVKVRNKQTGQTGSVTPYKGMENKYELL